MGISRVEIVLETAGSLRLHVIVKVVPLLNEDARRAWERMLKNS